MQNYIIEKANLISKNGKVQKSLLIMNKEIRYIANSLPKDKLPRIDGSAYLMTPGHVCVDYHYAEMKTFEEFKMHQRRFIDNGCTTLIIPCKITTEKDVEKKLRIAVHEMINSSIDFIVGLYAPITSLTPALIRLCKRKKIPFILTDICQDTDITNIAWGWLKEAMALYNLPIYPLVKITDQRKKEQKIKQWAEITAQHHIATSIHFPSDSSRVSKEIMMQIGLYPLKGEIRIGGDVDYNFYQVEKSDLVDESNKLDYDNTIHAMTVHNGIILKAGEKIYFRPGFGKELKIDAPGIFQML